MRMYNEIIIKQTEVLKMSRYTGPVGNGGAFLIVLTCILVLVAPPVGFIMSLALAFWKD